MVPSDSDTSKSITQIARELRKNPTQPERKLWSILRKKQLGGYRFLRQKPIIYKQINRKAYFFIADFYCAEKKLIIELDGQYHRKKFQMKYDKNRDYVLKNMGITTLRIKNEEIENIDKLIRKILSALD